MSIVTSNISLNSNVFTNNIVSNYAFNGIVSFSSLKNYLIGHGIWQKLDVFHCRIGWSAGDLATNEHIKNQVSGSINTVNDMTHSNLVGYTGNSLNSYINWLWNPTDDAVNYISEDACFFSYVSQVTGLSISETRYCLFSDQLFDRRTRPNPAVLSSTMKIQGVSAVSENGNITTGMRYIGIKDSQLLRFTNETFDSEVFAGSPVISSSDVIEFNSTALNLGDSKITIAFSGAGAYLTQEEVTVLNAAIEELYTYVNT